MKKFMSREDLEEKNTSIYQDGMNLLFELISRELRTVDM